MATASVLSCVNYPLELFTPSDYRSDITADEEGNPFVYAYNIEATGKPV